MSELTYADLKGLVYDVDDTLLNNFPPDGNPFGLHERSRLAAIYEIATELGHDALLAVTAEENDKVFLEAPTHTVDAAIWELLCRYNVVERQEIILDHPVLTAIVERKATLHMDMLLTAGVEVRGASAFIRAMEQYGPRGKQAIASGARLDEIQTFLGMYNIAEVFPRHRIIARGDYEHPKPHADPFERGFRTLGLPDTAAMRRLTLGVEDDPKGYRSARAAGLCTAVVTTRYPADAFIFDGHRPDFIATDMHELGEQLRLPSF